METRYFTKKHGKEYRHSMKNVDCMITSKTVRECASELTDLGEFVSVHLRWVKGLSGVHSNERGDLYFWDPTDSEDSDQQEGGRG